MAARLSYLERAQLPAEVQTVYDNLQKATGRVSNMFKLMAYHPKSLPPFFQWYPTLREGVLDMTLRQLAYASSRTPLISSSDLSMPSRIKSPIR